MINTPAIKDLILDGTRIGEIRDFIAEGREQYGMQTFDQCLTDLVSERRGDVRGRQGGGEQPVGLRAQDADVLDALDAGSPPPAARARPAGDRDGSTPLASAATTPLASDDSASHPASGAGATRRNADQVD